MMKYKTEMQCNDEIQTEIQNKSHSFIGAHIYFLLCYLLGVLVLHFTLRSIHFELIFVKGIKFMPTFFFFFGRGYLVVLASLSLFL